MSGTSSEASSEFIASLGAKYMWWPAMSAAGHSEERIIAQVMHRAAPGWIGARSWDFWRGRLRAQAGLEVPERPPRRTFHAAPL
jgi:hypothetical protein